MFIDLDINSMYAWQFKTTTKRELEKLNKIRRNGRSRHRKMVAMRRLKWLSDAIIIPEGL